MWCRESVDTERRNVTMAYQNPRSQCHGISGKSTYPTSNPTTSKNWCQMISGGVNPTLALLSVLIWEWRACGRGCCIPMMKSNTREPLVGLVDHPRKWSLSPPLPMCLERRVVFFQFAGCSLFPKQREVFLNLVGACCDEQMNSWDGCLLLHDVEISNLIGGLEH